jgi:hypothetical protein
MSEHDNSRNLAKPFDERKSTRSFDTDKKTATIKRNNQVCVKYFRSLKKFLIKDPYPSKIYLFRRVPNLNEIFTE